MNIGQKNSTNRWKFFVFGIFAFLIFFNLDVFLPLKHFSVSPYEPAKASMPQESLKSYSIVYDVYTNKSGLSTIGEKELLKALMKNNIDIAFLSDCTYLSSRLEGIYGDKILISRCYTKNGINFYDEFSVSKDSNASCYELFNLTKSVNFDLLHVSSLFKFFLFSFFDEKKAYDQLTDFVSVNLDFKRFSNNPCFLSGVGFYSRLKFLETKGTISFLDVNYTLPLVLNKIYLSQELTSDISFSKSLIFDALKNGNTISIFSRDFKGDIFVEEGGDTKPIGSLVSVEKNPKIFITLDNQDILIVVYKNGQIYSAHDTNSLVIKPKKEGFYTFVAYKYNMKLPFGFYTGVKPLAFLGNVFIQ
ncbi:MAG: hypothetical protein GXO22_00290 [Aquificae bacterium]|nr:hypothetical protein [Aquificota bacterium]